MTQLSLTLLDESPVVVAEAPATPVISAEAQVVTVEAPVIESSFCLLCQAQGLPHAGMVRHHPDLPIWRCQADDHHRFWLVGRKGGRHGVWLGHSRADPGSGPGEIPGWAEK